MTLDSARSFGPAVRARRAELGITLEQLAAASGVSRGTLSRIEHSALDTSLSNALAIAQALSIDLSDLHTASQATLLRAEDALRYVDDQGITRTSLATPAPGVELIAFLVPAGATSAKYPAHRTRTQETLHVLEGQLRYQLGDTEYALAPGDTLTVRADQPHQFTNSGRRPCALHMLTTTPH